MAGAGPAPDPADEAMVARARDRFAAERRGVAGAGAGRERRGALPNLIVIGGLKCGTTSLHHYLNLHPRGRDVATEGAQLLRRRAQLGARAPSGTRATSTAAAPVRGESSPHYTNLPRFEGVAERMRELLDDETRLVYMVRDPIDRLLSHYLHNVGGGYESRPLAEAVADPESAYVARGRYATQLEPYLRELRRRADRDRLP